MDVLAQSQGQGSQAAVQQGDQHLRSTHRGSVLPMTTGQINIWRGWVRQALLAAQRERRPFSPL